MDENSRYKIFLEFVQMTSQKYLVTSYKSKCLSLVYKGDCPASICHR